MKRRVLLIAAGALAAVTAARLSAQPSGKQYRIGVLSSNPLAKNFYQLFAKFMLEHDWAEGRDFIVDGRASSGNTEPLAALATELVAAKVDLLLVFDNGTAYAARRASSTIPIVMYGSGFPVESGLVESLAHPGGNITGNAMYASAEVWSKYLEFLKELLPRMRRVTLLYDWLGPGFLSSSLLVEQMRRGARVLGVSLNLTEVRTRQDLIQGLARVRKERPDALFVTNGPIIASSAAAREVAEFAIKHRLPTMTDHNLGLMRAGILMTYHPDYGPMLSNAVSYVDRILRGAEPGDLPIQQPTRFLLVINHKTAKAIGLSIPQSLLARADQVIE